MNRESFWFLAGLIAAHPDGRVLGRLRLQRTAYLLQRAGFPSNYLFSLFFGGPYSDGLFAELRMLVQWEVVRETKQDGEAEEPDFLIEAEQSMIPADVRQEVARFGEQIGAVAKSDALILDLAATYFAFRELGSNHDAALQSLKRQKGSKWKPEREAAALGLLASLRLPVTEPVAS